MSYFLCVHVSDFVFAVRLCVYVCFSTLCFCLSVHVRVFDCVRVPVCMTLCGRECVVFVFSLCVFCLSLPGRVRLYVFFLSVHV